MEERDDWVADVRRWCLANRAAAAVRPAPGPTDDRDDLRVDAGYAMPPPRLRPDARRSEFGTLN